MPDHGEATIGAIAGAVATGLPVILAVTARQAGDQLIWIGAMVAALTAVGIAVGKAWRLLVAVSHRPERLEQIDDLVQRAERMEIRQLSSQEQLRDLAERLDNHLARECP